MISSRFFCNSKNLNCIGALSFLRLEEEYWWSVFFDQKFLEWKSKEYRSKVFGVNILFTSCRPQTGCKSQCRMWKLNVLIKRLNELKSKEKRVLFVHIVFERARLLLQVSQQTIVALLFTTPRVMVIYFLIGHFSFHRIQVHRPRVKFVTTRARCFDHVRLFQSGFLFKLFFQNCFSDSVWLTNVSLEAFLISEANIRL